MHKSLIIYTKQHEFKQGYQSGCSGDSLLINEGDYYGHYCTYHFKLTIF